MIEFPKFYYKRPSKWEFQVSSYPHEGFLPSPMHYRNGIMHDYVYVAKYMSNTSYMSRPGQTILTNSTNNGHDGTGYTIANFRNGFRSKGMYCADYATYCSINILMLVKYATLNIQNLIGYGWCGTDRKANTGGADEVRGKDGYVANSKMSNGQIVAMGIEDYWGNVFKCTDGIFKNSTTVFINTDIEHITSNPSSSNHPGWVEVPSGTFITANEGFSWITDFNYDTQFPWSFLPSSGQYISSTFPTNDPGLKISDGYYMNPANSDYIAVVGCHWNARFGAGPFYLGFNYKFSSAFMYISAASFFLSD